MVLYRHAQLEKKESSQSTASPYIMVPLTLLCLALAPSALAGYTAQGFNVHSGETFPVATYAIANYTSSAMRLGRTSARAASDVTYSGNWCGAVQTPQSGYFTSVTGVWDVVSLSPRNGQSTDNSSVLSQWLGIDGAGCSSGLLQGGTISQVGVF